MLLLLDEVQTGWGRTGAPMAYMGYGVKPDAVSMAEGYGRQECRLEHAVQGKKWQAALGAGTHGSTYGGHPVACAQHLLLCLRF